MHCSTRDGGLGTVLLRRCAGLAVLGLLLLVAVPLRAQPGPAASEASGGTAQEAVATARRHFEAEAYGEGLQELNEASRRLRRDHRAYAQILVALARFYEEYAADYRRVRSYVREIRKLPLPADHPAVVQAKQIVLRLDAVEAEYGAAEALLRKVAVSQYDEEAQRRRVAELRGLIEQYPDYPRLAVAYHYLGENRLKLERYRKAYFAFDEALELKPGIGYSLPTETRKERAFELWVRRDLAIASWAVSGAVLLLAALSFFASRPWRWLRVRHGQVLLLVVVLWWLSFRIAVASLGDSLAREPGQFPGPVYWYSQLGTPLSEVLDTLWVYGLAGLLGAYTLALVASRRRPRFTWAFASAAIALVLFAALMTQFGLRYGAPTFKKEQGARYPYLRGAYYYALTKDQDPFILTHPLRYCGFQATIEDMDEPVLQRWFERYADECARRADRGEPATVRP